MRDRWGVVALCVALLCGGCDVELGHGLGERQANEIAALLERAGVAADKLSEEGLAGTFKVRVSRADAPRAYALLEAADLPRRRADGVRETFAEPSLMPSPLEERARLQAALAADLERTLERLPGVTAARVHLAMELDDPLHPLYPEEPTTAKAAVLLKTRAPLSVSRAELQQLVAGAIPSLDPPEVSLVITGAPAEVLDPSPSFDRLGPLRLLQGQRALAVRLLAFGLALVLALALAVLGTVLRIGRLRRRLRDLEVHEAPGSSR